MLNRYSSFVFAAAGFLSAHAQISLSAADNAPAIGDTFIGLTGTSASLVVMNSYFANPERPRDFSSTDAIPRHSFGPS